MFPQVLLEGHAYRRDRGVDLLLTSEWGEGFDNLLDPSHRPLLVDSARDATPDAASGLESAVVPRGNRLSPAVGRLGRELSPRYHFAGGQPVAFSLPPYRNQASLA